MTDLTIYEAARIAKDYGTDIRYEIANFRQACDNHGKYGKTATEFFDSYMAQKSSERHAESAAALDFEYRSYGRD